MLDNFLDMAPHVLVFFLVIFWSSALFIVKGENGCKDLVYLPCIKNKNFTRHVIKTFRLMVPGLEVCQSKCFNEKYCVSYNLGPVTHQTLTCELNDLDHVTHPNDVITQEGAHYCPIKNPCSFNPCAAKQHCTPDFYNDKYICSGSWASWSVWTSCDCGLTTRKRACMSSPCSGDSVDKKTCSMGNNYPVVMTTEGKSCVFPFKYKGVCYSECTNVDYTSLWCSYHTEYQKGKWGNCK